MLQGVRIAMNWLPMVNSQPPHQSSEANGNSESAFFLDTLYVETLIHYNNWHLFDMITCKRQGLACRIQKDDEYKAGTYKKIMMLVI